MALIVLLTAIGHYSIHYGALIRGYETGFFGALRNLSLIGFLAILPVFIKKFLRYQGNWTIYTACVLLFSIGLTVQYRLFSDNEYVADIDRVEREKV